MAMIRMKKGKQTAWVPVADAEYFRSVGWVRVTEPARAAEPAEDVKPAAETKPAKEMVPEKPESVGPRSRKEPARKPAT